MQINFPRQLIESKSGIEFLCLVWRLTKKQKNETITWNFKYTKKVETNLLAFLGLVLNRSYKHGNNIKLIIRDSEGNVCKHNNRVLKILFNKYSNFKSNAINYRYFNLKNNNADKEKNMLYQYIFNLNLKNYTQVKTLISEFIANINMHTELRECAISGYLDKNTGHITFSICNMGKTIHQNIRETGNIEFENDTDAIIWALKKTNTTRKSDESGGLGLYLLRKYLHNIGGTGCITSGKSIIELKQGFFYEDNVNNIILNSENKIEMNRGLFPGTMITIRIPYILDEKSNEKNMNILEDVCLI